MLLKEAMGRAPVELFLVNKNLSQWVAQQHPSLSTETRQVQCQDYRVVDWQGGVLLVSAKLCQIVHDDYVSRCQSQGPGKQCCGW